MAIDINEPVEEGKDLVINHEDGTQTLGSAADLQAARDNNDVIGEPGPAHDQVSAADKEAAKAEKVPEAPAEEAAEGKPAGE